MFISSQAVHDPFADNNGKFPDGVPRTYLNGDTYDYIYATYQGAKVRPSPSSHNPCHCPVLPHVLTLVFSWACCRGVAV
jgi:hypothetical protein